MSPWILTPWYFSNPLPLSVSWTQGLTSTDYNIAQMKELRCPSTNEWIKKIWYTHTHTHTQWNIMQPPKK